MRGPGRRAGGRACDANGHEGGTTASLGATDWLSLAAAPTFAIMTLLTSHGGGPGDILCSTAHDASPMTWLKMTWLNLISRRCASRATLVCSGS